MDDHSPKLSGQALEAAVEKSPAPRVTKELMMARMASVEYIRFGTTVTICSITLDNGYSVRGESACVNPENYDQEIGEDFAYENAFNKLWPLFGLLLAESNFIAHAKAQ